MARVQTRRTTSRGNTPLSPPRQVVSPQSSPNVRRSTRGQSNNSDTLPNYTNKGSRRQLAAVQEEGDTIQVAQRPESSDPSILNEEEEEEEEEEDDGDEDEGEINPDIENLSEDSDVDSAYDLEAQLSGMDRDLIIDSLPALFREASNILSLFRPEKLPGIIDDIASKTTTVGKRFANFKGRLDITSQPCRNDNFLVVDVLVHKLANGPDYDQGAWRPDALLYMTNLAIFVSAIITGDKMRVASTLDLMYNNFPGAFLLGALRESENISQVYGTNLIDSTIELAVALRTEFFLRTAEDYMKAPSFDPDNILRQTFFDEDGKLRGFEDLTDDTIIEKAEKACTDRVKAIRGFFSRKSKNSIDLKGLRVQYTWQHFCALVMRWAAKRRSELDFYVSDQGGPEAIVERLIEDDPITFRRRPDRVEVKPARAISDDLADKTPVTTNRPRRSLNEKPMSVRMQQHKKMKQRLEEAESVDSDEAESEKVGIADAEIAQSPSQGADATHADSDDGGAGAGALPNGDEEIQMPQANIVEQTLPKPTQETIVPTQDTAKVLAAVKRQALQSNKENIDTTKRFIDRQAGAKRVEWNESQNKGKRTREMSEIESDPDEFEVDSRPLKKSRAVKRSGRTDSVAEQEDDIDSLPEVSALVSTQKSNQLPPSAQPRSSRLPLQQRTTKVNSRNEPTSSSATARSYNVSSQNDPPRPSQTQQANTAAKINIRRFNDMAGARAPQVRRAWDEEEIDRLMEYVDVFHGTQWARMLQDDQEHPDGPKLQRRDQVALKDKARNIKMDFLKACRSLPRGFQNVTMKASDLRKLEALGIPIIDGPGGRFIEQEEEE